MNENPGEVARFPTLSQLAQIVYGAILLVCNICMLMLPWGAAYLSIVILATYLIFRPGNVFHPNNMMLAFYGLYIVLASSLSLLMHFVGWQQNLDWTDAVFWQQTSVTTLLQAEFTFLVLYFAFHIFCGPAGPTASFKRRNVHVRNGILLTLFGVTTLLVFAFLQATGGLEAWLTDYSRTYLTKREGNGLLNFVTIAVGNIVVFLLGVKVFLARGRRWPALLAAAFIMGALAYIGGIKGRLVWLLVIFIAPALMQLRFKLNYVALFGIVFMGLLYLTTLLRTNWFYASPAYFIEMLVNYFNAYQLHDMVVMSREPAFGQTVFMIFTKPLQLLGVLGPDADFDISVMLTKEYFPNDWYLWSATQQWPLDTELYLNYFGVWLSWIPLLTYGFALSWLFRASVVRGNLFLLPIYLAEFQRLFSALRGTLIPWEMPFNLVQYALFYVVCRLAIRYLRDESSARAQPAFAAVS